MADLNNPGKNVLLLGPGYIGRELIDRLLEESYHITTLVRRPEAAMELDAVGVKSIPGTLSDLPNLINLTSKNDIIFHTATADDIPSVQAIIRGIEARASEGKHTIYIHTSGASLLSDDGSGEYVSEEIYSDKNDVKKLEVLPDTASHRLIDLEIIHAREKLGGMAKLFIMTPPLIYGSSKHEKLSIQAVTMVRFAIKHGYAGYVGKGKGTWSLVHVKDLSRGYMSFLHWCEMSGEDGAKEAPYVFCENGEEITWGEIAVKIGKGLKNLGIIKDETAREIPEEEFGDLFGKYSKVVIGGNARNRADRLRDLGWRPVERSFGEAFELEELPLILKEDLSSYAGYFKPAASGSG